MQIHLLKSLALGLVLATSSVALAQNSQPVTDPAPTTTPGGSQVLPATVGGPTAAPADPTAAPQVAPTTSDTLATTPAPAATTEKAAAKPKPTAPPAYTGKICGVDKKAMSLCVEGKGGKSKTFQVTSKTRFVKAGKPATFAEAAVGENVAIVSHKSKAGKVEAVTVRYTTHGAKDGAKATGTKSDKKAQKKAVKHATKKVEKAESLTTTPDAAKPAPVDAK